MNFQKFSTLRVNQWWWFHGYWWYIVRVLTNLHLIGFHPSPMLRILSTTKCLRRRAAWKQQLNRCFTHALTSIFLYHTEPTRSERQILDELQPQTYGLTIYFITLMSLYDSCDSLMTVRDSWSILMIAWTDGLWQKQVTDGCVVMASVAWNALSWSTGHGFKSWMGQTCGCVVLSTSDVNQEHLQQL